MGNIPACSKEVFLILRSFDLESVAYNEDGNVVFEPEEARRIFVKSINMLVAFVEGADSNSMRVYLGNNIDINSIKELRERLRITANKFSLLFHIREFGKVLSPKDFATPVSVTETQRNQMNITEGLYGTSKSSYLKLENARMIVRHKNRINENALGARGRNIEAIFIENSDGERILFPTTNLVPARALTSHVDQGGNWADDVGQQIMAMAKDFAALTAASRHIYLFGANLDESAGDLRQTIRENMSDMRRVFEGLCRRTRYPAIRDSLANYSPTLNENSDINVRVTELASLLNAGEHALNEAIIETVARVLEDDNRFKLAAPPKNNDTVLILGRKVAVAAWDDFKKRSNIALFAKPDVSRAPSQFSSEAAKLAFFTGALAEQCKDDSFANLLTFISDRLPEESAKPNRIRDADLVKNMKIIATLALRYAGASPPPSVIKTKEVREFTEWVESFSAEKMLSEDWRNSRSAREADTRGEAVLDYLILSYDPSDFIEWLGLIPEDTEALNKHEIINWLERYLNKVAEDEGADSDLICDETARQLYPKTRDAMEALGFSIPISEELGDEDELTSDDISREDVILPKKKDADLFDEVTTDSEHTGDYLARMQAQAGSAPNGYSSPVTRNFV